MHSNKRIKTFVGTIVLLGLVLVIGLGQGGAKRITEELGDFECGDFALSPPFLTASAQPLVMLVMARNHKLYYEAYNDASDIDGDGVLDLHYKPSIDYYGYFDSYKYYEYDSTNDMFVPVGTTTNKKVPSGANDYWSGDYLNYLTMSRMDCLRKVLYGGKRYVDEANATVLERAYIPQDAHTWGKEYFSVARDGYDISEYTPFEIPIQHPDAPSDDHPYVYHLFASTTLSDGGDPLLRVMTTKKERIWEWVSKERPVADSSIGTPTDYVVRVKVGVSSMPEENCWLYPGATNSSSDNVYKPVGVLQKYGQTGRIKFGLISGSYKKNMSGGVLRRNVEDISDEVSDLTGQFTAKNGIISTLNKFKIYDFDYSDHKYNGGWDTSGPMDEGDFPDWGNPIGEMMYEALHYFSGGSQTSAFTYNSEDANLADNKLGLPLVKGNEWVDPYDSNPYCAKPIMLVLSDIYPTYDSDQLPGVESDFGSMAAETIGGGTLNVKTLANIISTTEGVNGTYYIGQVDDVTDGACTQKTVDSFGDIRGLCPEEPTKEGSYYSAAVAYYGKKTDIHTSANETQSVDTYAVALSSPLPEINIPVGSTSISLVPFGKTLTLGSNSVDLLDNPPTCTIVDFYVESLNATHGKFRINFEDVEQGADHDMDVVCFYEYTLTSNNTVDVTIRQDYAAAGYLMHLGYIITGTTADGVYLDVPNVYDNPHRNVDVQYSLDTGDWVDGKLTRFKTRTFTASGNPPATLLENPLYYAAKWGGFTDSDGDNKPDLTEEWDKDGDGEPDNYFFVANPTRLETQINKAFSGILKRVSSGSAASVISGSRSGAGALYQAVFWPADFDDNGDEITWFGDVHGLFVSSDGKLYEDTDGDKKLDLDYDQSVIFYYDGSKAKACIGGTMTNGTCVNGTATDLEDINYLWSAEQWLGRTALVPDVQRSAYSPSSAVGNNKRYILTWIDGASSFDGKVQSSEVVAFTNATVSSALNTANATGLVSGETINWVRGLDQTGLRSRRFDDSGTYTYKRLGDVVHSTPVAVATPMENYDIVWGDKSYSAFYKKYRKRRNMIYFGGNDGMLHAMNGGFFSPSNNRFYKHYDYGSGNYSDAQGLDLGAEAWAYVPYNLLPHLECLTDPDYEHQYYVDLHPRVFDVRIWESEFNSTAGTHPNGWGTIMVCGMRLGGAHVDVDGRDFASSYVIFDITDPESPPTLLGEITYDYDDNSLIKMGYSLSVPSVVPQFSTVDNKQKWFLMLGTGPDAGSITLTDAASTQKARVAVIPLNELAKGAIDLRLEDGSPTEYTVGRQLHADQNSYVGSEFVAVDYDFDFRADIFYYGIVKGTGAPWDGLVWRLRVQNKNNPDNYADPSKWDEKKLIDPGKPVTGGPNVGFYNGKAWVYFGTGRFLTADDSRDTDSQYFFGVKEPRDNAGGYNYNVISWSENSPGGQWVDSSDILVRVGTGELNCTDGTSDCLPGGGAINTFSELEAHISGDSVDNGWFRKLSVPGERVVGQPTLLGGLVNFTTYIPSTDECKGEGTSRLYALYYRTGTAWKENVFGETDAEYVSFMKDLGQGLSLTPTLHIGTEEGARVILQTSTGEIINIHQPKMPFKSFKAGKAGWHTHDVP